MTPSDERRLPPDRRGEKERRGGKERRRTITLVKAERRQSGDRRADAERRRSAERRVEETTGEHLRDALRLVAHVAESPVLTDELRRDLDAAIFRLRFALDRLESGDP
jgi:hypothetical protein